MHSSTHAFWLIDCVVGSGSFRRQLVVGIEYCVKDKLLSMLKEEHRVGVEAGASADAVTKLISFYQLNGYAFTSDESDVANPIVLVRGERGAGWYSSEMTALFTELEIDVESDAIILRYAVDVKGQRLKQGDRAFWGQEARSAAAVVQNGAEAVDRRPAEVKRVARELKQFYVNGVMFTVIFVLFVLILILLGIL